MGWNNAIDYKPPTYEDVLITDGNECDVGQWYGEENGGWASKSDVQNRVTHWRWLPALPVRKNA